VTWLWWAGTLIPFGFVTPVLFAAAAVRVRKPVWGLWAALYAVVVVALGVLWSFVGRLAGRGRRVPRRRPSLPALVAMAVLLVVAAERTCSARSTVLLSARRSVR